MDALDAEAGDVGHDRDEPGAHERRGQQRADEEPAHVRSRLALEDEPGPHPHDAQARVVALDRDPALRGWLQEGDRRATPTISETRGSPDSARTTLVPRFPVAPVTTMRMVAIRYPRV